MEAGNGSLDSAVTADMKRIRISKNIQIIYDPYISSWGKNMGIVKITDALHDDLREASRVMARSINAQAEYWLRIGMLAEQIGRASCRERGEEWGGGRWVKKREK